MNITKRLLTINHTPGRPRPIDMIVIHVTEGSASSVRSWFNANAAQVSAHYMVCMDGTIDQFVSEDDQAWHAGRVDHPTAPLVIERPHINPNAYSIGIEHEGTGTQPLTAAQRAASVELIRDICTRRNIPIDRTHVVGHHEVYSLKTCPGAIDVNALVALAANPVTSSVPVPFTGPAPRIVWSDFLGDYLVVTRVASDTDWSFVQLKHVGKLVPTKANAPLSTMPANHPITL